EVVERELVAGDEEPLAVGRERRAPRDREAPHVAAARLLPEDELALVAREHRAGVREAEDGHVVRVLPGVAPPDHGEASALRPLERLRLVGELGLLGEREAREQSGEGEGERQIPPGRMQATAHRLLHQLQYTPARARRFPGTVLSSW